MATIPDTTLPDFTHRPPLDPAGGVRTTAQLRTARHADDRRPMLNQYIRLAKVGSGQHGEVLLCYDMSNNRHEVAIKAVKRHNPRAEKWTMMRKKNLPTTPHTPLTERLGTTEHKIRKEIAIMKKCRHGHVVRLLEVIDDKLKEKIYMVMEYLGGGEVKWKNTNHEPIQTITQSRRIIRDVILGLEYLHYQGIIHRDIKPANLLWTSDRSKVKISDFGVSHFSYAQRLAAAGRDRDSLDNPHDPILLDDSDLSKTAGTPSFLAPEVVFDSSADTSPINSPGNTVSLATVQARPDCPAPRRLPITKSIDVWALGVTLYCLLFGRTPFRGDQNEWVMYKAICSQDWDVADTMGFDQLPTGGRHPQDPDTEGYIIIDLLGRLLQKDCRQRATLDQVKRHQWITRDLHDPQRWLRETSPNKSDMVMVTESETSSAMSPVTFRWNWGRKLTRQISTFLRTVRERPARETRRSVRRERRVNNVGVRSLPQELSTGSVDGDASSAAPGPSRRAKGKRPARPTEKSAPSPAVRSKSIERWPMSKADSLAVPDEKPKTRRGSETLLVPARLRRGASGSTSPAMTTTTHDAVPQRFSLSAIWHWRFNKYPPHGSSAPSAASNWPPSHSPTSQSTVSMDPLRTAQSDPGGGLLLAARRASSWGENSADFVEEVTSLNSDDHEVDEDAMLFGAGGVCNDRSQLAVNPRPDGAGGSALRQHHQQQQPDRSMVRLAPDPHAHARRQLSTRSFSTSPLAHVAYGSEARDGPGGRDSDEWDDEYSSSAEDFDDEPLDGEDGFDDDDDDSEEEEAAPIVVRRRFPTSPPRSMDSDTESL